MTLFGLGLILIALIVIFFSSYRSYLVFVGAGMLAWIFVEILGVGLRRAFDISMMMSYVVGIGVLLFILLGILLREDRKAQRLAARRYIEHTPFYEN